MRTVVAGTRPASSYVAPLQFIGQSPQVVRLLEMARQAAATDAPVLITGESGTGKEILARTIHQQSRRREHAYVAVNCGAIAGSLEESELFGYVPGAFTGADGRKQGRFEAAHSGTIFLDEIGETSTRLQVKLLRVLQDGEYAPVGSSLNLHCDVRVVAATNQDLLAAVRNSTFRADLYYRLDVVRLHVPPLRERKDDIPSLARHFAFEHMQRYAMGTPVIEPPFFERLLRHHYPGNVRELSNYVHRAVISSNGAPLTADLLPAFDDDSKAEDALAHPEQAAVDTNSFHGAKKRLIEAFEREFIIAVLTECGGIIHRAADRAGLSERSFHAKLRQYGIDGASFRAGAQ
ncbi:MAG: sigma-54-dependent Fis family transcriptional regulator [Acidobacteria bacterium]|nr:sigma-54-dependent Fis family transcriptional regulator [Acidobacteriota bacterium]